MIVGLIKSINERFLLEGLHQRILRGATWSAIATIASRGSLLVALFLTARILGAEDYGAYAIIQSSIAFFDVFAAAGMGITATKHVAEYRNKDKEKTGEIISLTISVAITLGCIFSIVLGIFAESIARDILSNSNLVEPLYIGAVILFFNALIAALNGAIIGFSAFKEMAKANMFSGLVTVVAIPLGALNYGVEGALWGLLVSTILLASMSLYVVIKKCRNESVKFSYKLNKENWRLLYRFSLPAMLASILVAPVIWIGNTILVNQPNGYQEMGVFSAANQWFAIILFLPAMVTNSLMPVFSEFSGIKKYDELKRGMLIGLKLNMLTVVPFSLTVALLSPMIMEFYGKDFADRWDILIVVCLTAVAASTSNLLGNVFVSNNKIATHLFTNLFWAIIFLIFVLVLIKQINGAMAMALAMLFAFFLKTVVVFFLSNAFIRKVS